MNLQAEKIKLIEWLKGIKDIALLEQVSKIRAASIEEVVEKVIEPMSVEQLKERALASEKSIEKGDVTSLKELKEEMKSW